VQKIISLFQRNYDGDRLVRDEVVPGAEWVLAGEGVATRKWDGACCMVRGGLMFKRYEVKPGRKPPEFFEPANEIDEITGKRAGWLRVSGEGPEDKWFRAAFQCWLDDYGHSPSDGTYEAVGPHFGGGSHTKNPECRLKDMLEPHGNVILDGFPRDFEGIKKWFSETAIPTFEGVVWHHPDGRMVKIKKRDFGL
jgi:hypothetical protein